MRVFAREGVADKKSVFKIPSRWRQVHQRHFQCVKYFSGEVEEMEYFMKENFAFFFQQNSG